MDHLDYFIAIAEEQNLSRAAKRLFTSQPALTRFVNNLEKEYGVKFFDRSKNPITLTPAGQLFLQEKVRMDNREQSLRRRLAEISTGDIHISIGTGISRATGIVADLIAQFCSVYPNVNISVKCSGERALPEMLAKQNVDFILGIFDPVGGMDVEWRYATVENICLLVPLKYGLLPADVSPVDTIHNHFMLKPEQLNGLPLIIPHSSLGSSINYQLMMNQFSIRPGRTIRSERAALICTLINRGLGYGFSSVFEEKQLQNERGAFVSAACTLPGLPTRRISVMAYRKDHPQVELLQKLADMLEAQIINSTSANVQYWKELNL